MKFEFKFKFEVFCFPMQRTSTSSSSNLQRGGGCIKDKYFVFRGRGPRVKL